MKNGKNWQIRKNSSEAVWWNEIITPKEKMLALLGTYSLGVLVFWLFYRSLMALVLAIPFMFAGFRIIRQKLIERNNTMLRSRFLDVLGSLESALEAGEAPEGAMHSCLQSLSLMYESQDIIVVEMSEIIRKLYSNQPLEVALLEFAEKTKDEDILRFAKVFSISKRSGGDLLEILRSTIHTMAEKEEVVRQIKTLISAKRMEAGIMAVMPLGIICYFQVMDNTFLQPLYSGIMGRGAMTVLLLAYAGCIYLMLRITDIKV